ncbi:hypothetical protein KIH79_03400 [Bifidobacterium sp. 82T10]|uniref:SpaA-like prealbumin fold domain-containing protein n=1 Tax=Bifidobacterium miconis TaxID=2834435 RepID=A0ABS6WD89_9BIFI|nr:SpaA isopeptide-forming pilin-related protein [Bifidobacterium miconis]MBW3092013.1 hypothetical protein [Bifidobacterium miconis]
MTRFTRRCGKLVAALLAGGMILAMPATAVADPMPEETATPTVQADQMPEVQTQTAVAPGYDCANVTEWDALKACVEAGGAVTLTGMIAVPTSDGDGATLQVDDGKTVILKAGTNGGLTGKDANGASVARNTSVLHVAQGGALTIAGGTYEYLNATAGGTLAAVDGALTVTGGKFTGNTTTDSGGVFKASAGSTVTFGVEDGKDMPRFEGNTGATGGVIYTRGTLNVLSGLYKANISTAGGDTNGGGAIRITDGSLTVSGGTFTDNTAVGVGGAISTMNGSTTIKDGTFNSDTTNVGSKGNHAPKGGAIAMQGGTLKIEDGTFDRNRATANADYSGGGAIYATGTTTVVTGGLFTGNGQDPGTCSVAVNDNKHDNCYGGPHGGQAGGGAIYSINGSLTIQGSVTFKGNYAKARDFGSGGGAVWAQGKMWIRNSADVQATKPLFEGNWAAIDKPAGSYDKNITTMLTGPATTITAGGAGGAVFLMNESTAYITGGEYTNNASGYLGGAIYTEEHTTTYVGRAVAWLNTAGHFGGGLWFCPSGSSAASKGGNIALFDNTIDNKLDANTGNLPHENENKDLTSAGDDLAIMNPYHKSDNKDINSNTFQLMDTWFTGRDERAVDWYEDGSPTKFASGYQDTWLGGDGNRYNSVKTNAGDLNYPQRYKEGSTSNAKIKIPADHATTLCLYYTNGKRGNNTSADCQKDGYYQDNLGDPSLRNDKGFGNRGVALKAVVGNDTEKENAQNTAQILITGNGSRLSGGGFGSDGVVVFDSPYSMSWNKADANTGNQVTSSSSWKVSTTDAQLDDRDDGEEKSPYMASSMRPAQCQATTGTLPPNCWQDDGDGNWSVTVTDNDTTRDNDNTMGSISIDNLAPGTYTLQEAVPPTGYELNTTEYTFTIKAAGTDNTVPEQPKLSIRTGSDQLVGSDGRTIGDKPVTGALTWKKIDSATNAAIGGSVWKITDDNDNTVPGYESITDNTGNTGEDSYSGKDTDPIVGLFKITLDATGAKGLKAGSYKLVETQTPNGYWMPLTAEHPFTVANEYSKMTATWTETDMKNGEISNTPTSVSWTKVDAGSQTAIGGAEWKLVRIKTVDGTPISSDQPAWTVLDCGADNDGCTGKTDSKHPTDASLNRWADSDNTAGGFKLEKLEPGTYELTETKAPAGYVLRKATYKFTITKDQPEQSVKLQSNGTDVPGNRIGNSRAISFLPSTGGPTPRGWLTIGMTLLAGSLATTWWTRRREAR